MNLKALPITLWQNNSFKKEYFDIVVANHVLFYVKDIDKGLKEVKRVLKTDGVFYCSTYGKTHMKEITDIVQNFDATIVLSENNLYERFGLENGESILKNYFSEIKKVIYPDCLIIDEAQPLIDYIMSCNGNQREILGPKMYEFKKYIQTILDEKGSIEISKNAGMFICKI